MQKSKQLYNTRIQKGGALLEDMRMLVRSWEEIGGSDTTREVRRLLGKKTLARSRDTLVRTFIPRFIQGDPPNAWMDHWPDRVREKCKTHKSFAIAHGLE